jgi:hypothetical protein
MLSDVTSAYLDQCRVSPRLREVTAHAPFPALFRTAYGDRLAHRPWFAERAPVLRFAADLSAFLGLLVSLPQRLFGGDLSRYCSALGIDRRRARLMCRLVSPSPSTYARPDVYFDGTDFRLLECNVCSALGGLDHAVVNAALLEVAEFREFADEWQLDYTDTASRFARALHEIADPVAGSGRPVVAMVEWKGGMRAYLQRMRFFQEVMGRAGLDIRLAEIDQLTLRAGKLFLDGTAIDMVLRYFSVDEICSDPAGEAAVDPVARAHEAGRTVLHTPLESYLFSNKGCLALLSDPQWRYGFTTGEAALIDRVLPWTRMLTAGLVPYVQANRESLILKPQSGFAGLGTVPGWATPPAQWEDTVRSLAGHGYIVQEKVSPQAEPVLSPVTGEPEDWIPAWSFFFTGEGYAGSSFVRAIPAGGGPIISPSTQPPMRTTSLFIRPGGAPAPAPAPAELRKESSCHERAS